MSAFTDKVVWVTGASSGIGEALAIEFASLGAKLILSARREEELKRVKNNCSGNKDNVLVLPLDLQKTDNINNITEQAFKHFGKIDILINNGGVSQRAWVKDTDISIDRQLMEVNYFGAIALTKSVLPYMVKNKSGHIVVISSIAGKFGYYMRSAYSAAKHALHGFFESLRMEVYDDNIFVTIVCPGKIKTNISYNALTAKGEKHNKMDDGQANGIDPTICAKLIVGAITNKKYEIYIGGKEMRAIWVKRFFPNIFYTLIRKKKPE